MDARTGRRAQPVQRQCHLKQGLDVGHAHQAKAHPLGACRVDAVVLPMQCQCGLQHLRCKTTGGVSPVSGPLCRGQQWHQHCPAARCLRCQFAQLSVPLLRKLMVAVHEGVRRAAIGLRLVELIHPGAAHQRRRHAITGPLAPVGLKVGAAIAVGLKQALDQGRWQRGGRQQHPCAQQPGPVHQAGEGGQVGQVKVIGLVQHQVTTQQAQHGCNLAATALALGGGGQVVNGADQQRGGQQRPHLRVGHGAAQQRVFVFLALKGDVAVFVQQVLAGRRAGAFSHGFVMRKQGPAGGTTHPHRQVVITQLQQLTEGPAGLHGQRAQAHRKGAAHA